MRASTTRAWAAEAKGTCHLTPSSTQPSPSARAVMATPSGPKPRWGSSQAGTTMASPDAIRGSHACCWASDPAATSTPALITALAKWGEGARDRPSSS